MKWVKIWLELVIKACYSEYWRGDRIWEETRGGFGGAMDNEGNILDGKPEFEPRNGMVREWVKNGVRQSAHNHFKPVKSQF